jgi:hypothetical protein
MQTRSIAVLLSCLIFIPATVQAQPKIVTSAQVNGTWKSKFGTFKVWALGKQRLQVEFSGTYEYLANGIPMANMGMGSGIATIENRTAVFKPEGAEAECAIVMNFVGGGLKVQQKSNCGFGHNVTAAGQYRKIITGKPQFGENRP